MLLVAKIVKNHDATFRLYKQYRNGLVLEKVHHRGDTMKSHCVMPFISCKPF